MSLRLLCNAYVICQKYSLDTFIIPDEAQKGTVYAHPLYIFWLIQFHGSNLSCTGCLIIKQLNCKRLNILEKCQTAF